MSTQSSLNLKSKESGPVECLGQTFASDEARREHYLKLLAEKLKDPEFRKIEGFPIGEDEDILALSDPPYYTACPNPWIGGFIKHYGRPYDPKEKYHREPFAADVSEGKNHPIYNAHSYHTKVPHRAIMRYILHYTEPGDMVFDGFCGTGMTGVAAQLCGDRKEVQELGYRVDEKGVIYDESGKAVSKIGARRTVLNDLAPIATFIAHNYNSPTNVDAFERQTVELMRSFESDFGWMYQSAANERIEYTVWSEVFTCPECACEINFLEEALDDATESVKKEFPCPECGSLVTKTKLGKVIEKYYEDLTQATQTRRKRVPVIIGVTSNGKRFERKPTTSDLDLLAKIESFPVPNEVPHENIPFMHMTHQRARMDGFGVTHLHHFYFRRPLIALGELWKMAKKVSPSPLRHKILFWIEQGIWGFSIQNRYMPRAYSLVNRYLSGVYYIPSQTAEPSPQYNLLGKAKRLKSALAATQAKTGNSIIGTGSSTRTPIQDSSLDYIFVDPPFGENIYYADLNYLIESWHQVLTAAVNEAILDKAKSKGLPEYQSLMKSCLGEFFRILKPGRWITVEFSNSQAAVWNCIQSTLQEVGFVVANVAALDKQQRSFRSVTSLTAVKQDLVISAYKPNGGLEERFRKSGQTVEGVWDFMRTHLRNLPVVKPRGGEMEFIAERDPRILHDRMVAFYIGHSVPVPLSSAEFQAELADKFPEREGMFFLAEQVAEWDQKRAQMQGVGQMSIFVEDEKSAIDWLRNNLKSRPSSYQDIQPEFMQQLGASWKKFETRPELNLLLEQNFLRYDGKGEVPSQIHSYLSTQNKDLRNLPKDDSRLQFRAKDRWYVPDPGKAVDVEKIRNKRLLQEFWELCDQAGIARPKPGEPNRPSLPISTPVTAKKTGLKKLKEVRSEAVRLGFRDCFAAKDYGTILAIAHHLPDNVVEEDEQLQMMHDMAVMRTEG